jgi:hypothetical protein
MTAKEFESFKSGIVVNTVKLKNGEMSVDDYVKTMKVILGVDTFQKVEEVLYTKD